MTVLTATLLLGAALILPGARAEAADAALPGAHDAEPTAVNGQITDAVAPASGSAESAAVGEDDASADGPQPMTAEDLWAMQRVGVPVVSPDGQTVIVPVTEYDVDENKSKRGLWHVDVGVDGKGRDADGNPIPPRRLTWAESGESGVAFSPDGRWIVFTATRGERKGQLFRLPLDGGEAEPLTDLPVSATDPTFFPDGKRIAFLAYVDPDLAPGEAGTTDWAALKERVKARKDDKTQVKISENRLVRYWDHYRTDPTVPHIFVLDLETREVTDLMPGWTALYGFGGFGWTLSPEGDEIVFAANGTEPPYQKLDFNLYRLDVASKAITTLVDAAPAWQGGAFYTPDGRYFFYSQTNRPEISPDFSRLMRVDRASGETVEMLQGWDFELGGLETTRDGKTLLLRAQNEARGSLFTLPADAAPTDAPRLAVRGGVVGAAFGLAHDRLLIHEQAWNRPPELFSVAVDGGDRVALTGFNDARLAQIEFGTREDITYPGADDAPVQMYLIHPPGFDAAPADAKWPLLVLIHGGPHGAFTDSFHFRWNQALFAAPGFVTAVVNFHGSTGFGQAFAESILGAHADKPFTDVMKAVDHVVARGYIDASRMAAAGGSYGGYLVSWILGHTDRFAALINHAGVYDLMAQFASDYTWSRPNNYGAAPWEDPERIDRWSPSRFARNFATPTLILHGEKDYRVPYTQGLNLHHVLTGKGVPSRLVIFPNVNGYTQSKCGTTPSVNRSSKYHHVFDLIGSDFCFLQGRLFDDG
ncbi:MAG: S9 family peptidase, partial [Acidobacteriota bacterium]